ncbi:large subunit ribosomal protein L7A [Propionispira arboris]|uniref:Large subunit ribosomal protein L7A n=1 Tax=Propionispira arboris TaxID=84035 RepID=A0A1H6Y7W7_9FIRM|nr:MULTISPECIES: ribosomal L7Ae/L30e/S12e/Gadd45 family protein [Propionispira]SEJ37388.1 large subunit ribosomal protein L7A [Propionispira arboris]
MTLEALKNANRVIGIKQVTKAVNKGFVESVFLADDADERVLKPLEELCKSKNIEVVKVLAMKDLGQACMIEVGAAAAAILK